MIGGDDSFTGKVGFVYIYKLEKIQDTGFRIQGVGLQHCRKVLLASCILYLVSPEKRTVNIQVKLKI